MEKLSLLYPPGKLQTEQKLPDDTFHDLSVDTICSPLADMAHEREMLMRMMRMISGDEDVVRYRCDVFEDILRSPQLREDIQKLLDRVDFLRTYGSFVKDTDEAGIWELVHRLDEMDEYIRCVQSIYECLSANEVRSEGLLLLKDYTGDLYRDSGFAELKKDIDALKVDASKVKSVTLGVNLNDRYEPVETGIVSINEKPFTKSNIISNFCDFLDRGDSVAKDAEWNGNLSFRTSGVRSGEKNAKMEKTAVLMGAAQNPLLAAGLANVNNEPQGGDAIRMLDHAISALLTRTVKKLKSVLSKHVSVSTYVITSLIPEFLFYIRWAEYIEKMKQKGFTFCKPEVLPAKERLMRCRGIYNMKLAQSLYENGEGPGKLVPNDLDFDADHRIYILTGANRGGKTTITQAVGLAFLMAQCGISVPAESFAFSPADNIFTHYPADENQTMDLGRLGEEASRFREIFDSLTPESLLLLNESFSTTSFEEGYFIARDVTRILLRLGVRTIYNTHIHKLAADLEELNGEEEGDSRIASLIVETEGSERSFRVRVAPPSGRSFAQDIAEKYGVTYELLEQKKFGHGGEAGPESDENTGEANPCSDKKTEEE